MEKTPEEIKKALTLCYEGIDCAKCPYMEDCFEDDEKPYGLVLPDALAYIKELERERAAAVNELIGTCQVCRWEETGKCASCHFNTDAWNVCESNWEWRGVKEE